MFVPFWGVVLAVCVIVYLLIKIDRLYLRIKQLKEIIYRLEDVEDHERVERTGDSEGYG